MHFLKKVPSSLPDRIVCVLHSIESAGGSSLNVGDLIVKHLHQDKNGHLQHVAVSIYTGIEVSHFFTSLSLCAPYSICLYVQHVSTYGTELLALVSHLFPNRPALSSKEVSEIDSMDGSTGLLVQSGFLADPVEDLPVQ